MHNPGICGVIMATAPVVAAAVPQPAKIVALNTLIDALNADTDMILVVAAESAADALAPAVWSRAGYMVMLAPQSSIMEALRVTLQEVMNRGRDAALVTWLEASAVSAATIRKMVADYCKAGDDIWAVSLTAPGHGGPVLLGRRMIELVMRTALGSIDELFAANAAHVLTIKATDAMATPGSSTSG